MSISKLEDKIQWLTENDPDSTCELNHGRDTAPIAEASLVIDDDGNHFTYRICNECVEALQEDNEWTLFICMNCSSTAWQLREYSRREYDLITKFTNGCPNCQKITSNERFN